MTHMTDLLTKSEIENPADFDFDFAPGIAQPWVVLPLSSRQSFRITPGAPPMSEIADIEHAPAGFSPEVQSAAQLAEVLVTAVNGAIDAGTKAVEALTALAYVSAELIASPPGKPWRDLRRSQRQYFDDSLGWYLAEIARQRARGPAP